MTNLLVTSKIKKCGDDKDVGDDDGQGHDENEAGLREGLQSEHDLRVIVRIAENDHSRSVPGAQHAGMSRDTEPNANATTVASLRRTANPCNNLNGFYYIFWLTRLCFVQVCFGIIDGTLTVSVDSLDWWIELLY